MNRRWHRPDRRDALGFALLHVVFLGAWIGTNVGPVRVWPMFDACSISAFSRRQTA
jgi:hypothetical protein